MYSPCKPCTELYRYHLYMIYNQGRLSRVGQIISRGLGACSQEFKLSETDLYVRTLRVIVILIAIMHAQASVADMLGGPWPTLYG